MKLKLLPLLCLALLSNVLCSQTNVYDSINFGGRWRTFLTHLPTGYEVTKKYPLLLAFHGGSPIGYQSIQFQSRLSQKSDSAGFIVVYPEGVKFAGNRTWNAGGCCAPATTLKIDDVGFVNTLLNNLNATLPVDTLRVYATGFSNGALLCYRLANQLTYRFAAIAPVAGDLVYYPWNPGRATPIISFHSYQDLNVKYFGGVTVGSTGTYFPPQDSMFQIIGKNYSCAVMKDTLYHNPLDYDHFKYSGCACNAEIVQYVSFDGDHSWPGGLSSGGVNVSNRFSATYLMWEFFKKYTTACQKTGLEPVQKEKEISIYPNQFSTHIYLKNSTGSEYVMLFNSMGKAVWQGHHIQQQNFSHLSSGLYLLKGGNKSFKLIKE